MTVRESAERSSRIYEKNVQYNDRTDKKLESLFPHSRHLLPPTDRGEEESLTAIVQNSVSLHPVPHRREACQFTRLDMARECGIMKVQKGKRCLHSGQTFAKSFVKMTVRESAERSSRIYEKNVQYNDRTDKKLESLFPHSRHLLPPTDRGEEEVLTACSDCSLRVQQRFRKLIISHRRKTCQFTADLTRSAAFCVKMLAFCMESAVYLYIPNPHAKERNL